MKKILAVVLLVLGLAPIQTAVQTEALTPWKAFGSGSAVGRGGTQGNPGLSVTSTTGRNPERLRLVLTGTVNNRLQVNWQVKCWNSPIVGGAVDNGQLVTRLPRIVSLSGKAGGVSNWRWCNLHTAVWAAFALPGNPSAGAPGTLRVKLQARYP